jgi:hypothetical protein
MKEAGDHRQGIPFCVGKQFHLKNFSFVLQRILIDHFLKRKERRAQRGEESTEGMEITTETQRTRSSDPEWEMVLSFCILDFSATP